MGEYCAMERKRIAIACQGGGSQTAFTAGVLKAFFDNRIEEKQKIVGLSGTSGGAVCAALAWEALLRGDGSASERLFAFWRANGTRSMVEEIFNRSQVGWAELVDHGFLPSYNMSPSSFSSRMMMAWLCAVMPRREFVDFRLLLENHIDFAAFDGLTGLDSPVLLVGAVNVLEGTFRKFNSRKGEISVDAIMASAAVPSLFPAVKIGEDAYWDGMFSDNPPTDELLDPGIVGEENIPQEIWVIRINPRRWSTVPVTPAAIIDRRNEVVGNLSLHRDLQAIGQMGRRMGARGKKSGIAEGPARTGAEGPAVAVREVEMSERLQERLDYASKLNRDAGFIGMLIRDGEAQGRKFLEEIL